LQPLIARQVYFALLGLVVIFAVASVDYRYWLALYRPIYFGIMVFLVSLSSLGQSAFGAQRWFQVGVLFLQPTEFAKIVAIIVLARYFEQARNQPKDFRWAFGGFLWAFGLVFWILIQPNLSNVVVVMVIFAAMLWINGMKIQNLLTVGAVVVFLVGLLVVLSILGVRLPFLKDYQQQRVLTFIFPNQNATYGATYNVEQALIAVGSGGFFGKGYGHGSQTQLRFLKVRHTDFIFSAVAEEFGMVGGIIVILTLVFIVWRCIRAAQKARDVSGSMIAFGVAVLIFFQGAVNIGVNLNVVPVSGLPLPFISYGGSGLTALMLGIGLVESVVMRHKQMDF
jgi:rod shape determining protein RodA